MLSSFLDSLFHLLMSDGQFHIRYNSMATNQLRKEHVVENEREVLFEIIDLPRQGFFEIQAINVSSTKHFNDWSILIFPETAPLHQL